MTYAIELFFVFTQATEKHKIRLNAAVKETDIHTCPE
jgi:hypothetical protein